MTFQIAYGSETYNNDICINISDSDNGTYTMHQEQTYPINLGSMELCKIGDYQDSIVKDNGKWYLEKKVRHLSLNISDMNNSEDYPGWKNVSDLLNDYPNKNTLLSNFTDYMCNMTNNDNVISVNTAYLAGGGTLFFNKGTIALTQTQWKEQYPNLVVELYYVLATPTYEEITDSTLISQLESIELLKGENNITITSENLPALLQLSYYKQTLQGNVEYLDKTKANKEDIPSLDNYYNKTEIDALLDDKADTSDIPSLDNYYNKIEIDTLLDDKADTSDIPTKTSDLQNDSGFITTDTNTTYALSKSGSTITLTGSDGTTTSVTDDNTTYTVNNASLSITQNGTLKGTFSANQSTDKLIALTDTTYSNATTSTSGLMSSSDKTKLNNLLRPYSLYSSNGSTADIVLSETSADFSYMEIYFKSTQYYPNANYQCTKVFSPNGKYVDLNDFWISGNIEFHFAQVYINGKTISRVENHNIFMDGSTFNHTTNKVLSIVKVVGYK
jgi:hypothetical protein